MREEKIPQRKIKLDQKVEKRKDSTNLKIVNDAARLQKRQRERKNRVSSQCHIIAYRRKNCFHC